MEIVALGLSILALLISLRALTKPSASGVTIEEVREEARRECNSVRRIQGGEIVVLRNLLARFVGGEDMTSAMVRAGALWREVDATEGAALVASGAVAVLDVRTPDETKQGVIKGALTIPLDEVEGRLDELPTGKPLLIYCSSGGRSPDACERLNREGIEQLLNLEKGIADWQDELHPAK